LLRKQFTQNKNLQPRIGPKHNVDIYSYLQIEGALQ